MPKWFDETILIKYWEDRCSSYEVGGVRITSAVRNPSFGSYPDISQNFLADMRIVPAEIEWVTTDFDRHGHDVNLLRESEGFVIVYKRDAGFPLPQVIINESDFISWFMEKAEHLCRETLSEISRITNRSREPQIFLFYLRKTKTGEINFEKALKQGVWGSPAGKVA